MPEQLDGPRRCGRDELLEFAVQRRDLLIERFDPLSGRPQRELRGLRRGAELPAGQAESSADRDLAAECLARGELISDLVRGGDDEVSDLEQSSAAGLHSAAASDAQQPDRLDDPVGPLRDRLGLAGLEQAGGHLRIDRVALADTPARVRVRLVDLDDPDVVLAQVAHERRGIRAGRLNRDDVDLSVAAQPVEQLAVARRGRREALRREQRPALVERGRVMGVRVRVDPANYQRVLLRHAVHAVLSVREGGLVGKGGQNSDEAL